ncbi:pyridine nucleotide-disulfide oxidoreductase domain-containing protein [Ditylenchus destructor]|uniref:Pyridine nucleotide-disulfide oxidoreductase domain-containing protein n=1 Tax=Ditylenchus destructor TaxID=166010 RepID=A0AAD4MRH7_9BILA|nr:pyridine nucleotide-disulfide oxidoreductase domain-containing protein [Ditylenchus destructor]
MAQSYKAPRLLILGTGWASYSVLKCINTKLYQVAVVSPRNHFLFTPLLPSTTVGTLEFRSIIEPIRNRNFAHASDYHLASVENIDFQNKQVIYRASLAPDITSKLDYDKIVIGVGALPSTFGVPGVREYSFFLKEVSDARAIRSRILDNFETSLETVGEQEKQRLRHVVIVGGGPTGIEFGAELYDFCKDDLSRLYKDFGTPVCVTLVEGKQILGGFDKRLQVYAEKKLRNRPNFSMIKANVTEVKADSVTLSDGRTLPCGLVVWSTGLAPRPFVQKLDCQKDAHGHILVDRNLNVLSDPTNDSYALGDCSEIIDMPLPATAQVAERQGRYLANRLNKLALNQPVQPFTFQSMGMLAYIGDYEALSDLKEFKLKGIFSWFLWRSAYLTRLGSWRLRLQVPLDWLKTMLFGRDTSRF